MPMHPRTFSNSGGVNVSLNEWGVTCIDTDTGNVGERGNSIRASADFLRSLRGKINFREGVSSLEIRATSYVGRVDVGSIRIQIDPKLNGMPLAELLRYAYGLRDLKILGHTMADTSGTGIQDVLILLLAVELEQLIRNGLVRKYQAVSEDLQNPRGRIDVQRLARDGGLLKASLPCMHHEREADWHLNRTLFSGVHLAARMAESPELRSRLQRIIRQFGSVQKLSHLDLNSVDQATRNLTRQTDSSASALALIRLLVENQKPGFESKTDQSRMPGFLFDMNIFFQRLLSRFLRENLQDHSAIDEFGVRGLFRYARHANPRDRKNPVPRPDLGLFFGKKLQGFIDAKYRDLWGTALPSEWLYQMSVYSLAAPCNTSVLLYASMATDGEDECIEIRHPTENYTLGEVILRPVPLLYLAALLAPSNDPGILLSRKTLALDLVRFEAKGSVKPVVGTGPVFA